MMKDNEIVKALKLCAKGHNEKMDDYCKECPFKDYAPCEAFLCDRTLGLINRQKAEIAELQSKLIITKNNFDNAKDRYDEAVKIGQKMNEKLINAYKKLQTAKSEARKEFVERLKQKFGFPKDTILGKLVYSDEIDNLLEEMESEKE